MYRNSVTSVRLYKGLYTAVEEWQPAITKLVPANGSLRVINSAGGLSPLILLEASSNSSASLACASLYEPFTAAAAAAGSVGKYISLNKHPAYFFFFLPLSCAPDPFSHVTLFGSRMLYNLPMDVNIYVYTGGTDRTLVLSVTPARSTTPLQQTY